MKVHTIAIVLAFSGLAWSQPDVNAVKEMTEGANRFLGALDAKQKKEATIAFDDEERFNFHYIPRERRGLAYKTMTPAQRKLAHSFLATGLSRDGMSKALEIMYLEQILFQIEGRDIRDPDLYFFTVFGEPSTTGTWGWRMEGHHLSLNFTVRGGKVVSSSPAFWGANPANVLDGPTKGMRALADEEILGRELLKSFDERGRQVVMIEAEAPRDIVTAAERRAEIGEPVGIALSDMTGEQKKAVMALVRFYARRMRSEIAVAEIEEIEAAGTDAIRFAWAGGDDPGEPHYYRIHGPTFLIEYDNTQNNANHIHTVWRDLESDWGRVDLLSQHYQKSPHHQRKRVHAHLADH